MGASPELIHLSNRGVIAINGKDKVDFLQGLVSNDVTGALPVYTCLLNPQGRFLYDLFVFAQDDLLLVDCEAARKDDLIKFLSLYKLRSEVSIDDVSDRFFVYVAWDNDAYSQQSDDPRLQKLGKRFILSEKLETTSGVDAHQTRRFLLGVPENSTEMPPKEDTLAELNVDLLNGISWSKGCYMGQEVTARMKYRGVAKKRLFPVAGDDLTTGDILDETGKTIGTVRVVSDGGRLGLALCRIEPVKARKDHVFTVNGQNVTLYVPKWLEETVK